MSGNEQHVWRFFRVGGFDQVRLDTAEDLLAIGKLDQKLWVALSCPVQGIEFDARTLSFVDTDADGFIRAGELIQAVEWAGSRLLRTNVLAEKLSGVPVSAIRADDEEGAAIVAAARALLADTGAGDLITAAAASEAQSRQVARAEADWMATRDAASPLGDATDAAYAAFLAVADKIEDWFVRGELAAYDTRATDLLNAAETALAGLSATSLKTDTADIAALPLARIAPDGDLSLVVGLNPAWVGRMTDFRDLLVVPLLGERQSISATDWAMIRQKLAPYAAWLAAKPDPESAAPGVKELERLAHYVRDLMSLANNFVSFRDFYTGQGKASFQIGTLYLDGRACDLCVSVRDAGKHASLAGLASIYLVYCDCTRGAEKMSIAAAMTAGDADQLMVGRNGVFYDRKGRDWNATITRIVDHPISLRQAFWSPYKRSARFVAEQIRKFAAKKDAQADTMLKTLSGKPAQAAAQPAATPTAFDVGKFAGIFAAIGLALGALGTALASVMTGLFSLTWWQWPLVAVGAMLAVSGPAMLIAWFKLVGRNLAPILDANGWAVNTRARINIPFGTTLTQVASLPEGAERSLSDPYADKPLHWGWYAGLVCLLGLLAFWWFVRLR